MEKLLKQLEFLKQEKNDVIEKYKRDTSFYRTLQSMMKEMSSEWSADGEEEDDIYIQRMTGERNISFVAITCLEAGIYIQLVKKGYREYSSQLQQLFDDLRNCLKRTPDPDQAVRDLLSIIHPKLKPHIQDYFSQGRSFIRLLRKRTIIPDSLNELIIEIARYFLRTDRAENARITVEELCKESSLRNPDERHKMTVIMVLNMLDEEKADTAQRRSLCRRYYSFFMNNQDELTYEFLWYYAWIYYGSWTNDATGKKMMKKADYLFQKVADGRLLLYGSKDNWLVAVPHQMSRQARYYLSGEIPDEAEWLPFFNNSKNRYFSGMEELSEDVIEIFLADSLFMWLSRVSFLTYPKEIITELLDWFFQLCEKHQGSVSPYISLRLAWNLKGKYYHESGNYVAAEEAYNNALEVDVSEETNSVLSREDLIHNLLMIYAAQNDYTHYSEMSIQLLEWMDDKEDAGEDVDEKILLRIMADLCWGDIYYFEMTENDKAVYYESVTDLCRIVHEDPKNVIDYVSEAIMFLHRVSFLQDIWQQDEWEMMFQAAEMIESQFWFNKQSVDLKILLYLIKLNTAWNAGYDNVESFAHQILGLIEEHLEEDFLSSLHFASAYPELSFIFSVCGNTEAAAYCIQRANELFPEIWHSYIRYLNDERLADSLFLVTLFYEKCYSVLRSSSDVWTLYDFLLQFKALASLAGRERNRVLRSMKADIESLDRIRGLQDTIAVMEADRAFTNAENDIESLYEDLRRLENEFALKFPESTDYTELSLKKAVEQIPDNSTVVEYHLVLFSPKDFLASRQEEPVPCIDIFILNKKNGQENLHFLTIEDAENIVEAADRFVDLLQILPMNNPDLQTLDEIETLRKGLYNALVKPIRSYLETEETIILAPDVSLVNLPLEILYDDEGERLIDNYQIVKIECLRDVLFWTSDDNETGECLVIGNPELHVQAEEDDVMTDPDEDDRLRGFQINLMDFRPLPFAEIEAVRVAQRCGTVPLLGEKAVKDTVLKASGQSIIHIATHGCFDLSMQEHTLFSTGLLFAGVKNWAEHKPLSIRFGNGLLTADEISRLDLHSVKLVVLSSCLSGMTDPEWTKGFQGMIGAFASAGVKYAVTHLWSEPDTISTVIFMDYLYVCLIEEKDDPPTALRKAQQYLRKLTVGKMREERWFDTCRQYDFSKKVKDSLNQLEHEEDRMRPFKNEVYWGGFSCYQCN